MAITVNLVPPNPDDTAGFDADAYQFSQDLVTFGQQANALAAAMNALSAGSAVGLPYIFSTTTADADPGAGKLRLDNATQNLVTTIRADLLGADGSDFTGVLDAFDDSTSTVKGHIGLQKIADPTKWIVFSVTGLASPAGYKNITVAVVAASAASPFADGDDLVLKFTRTGDKGDIGSGGAWIPLSQIVAANSATVDVESTFDATYDEYVLVATGVTVGTDGVGLRMTMKVGGAYASANYQYHLSNRPCTASTYNAAVSASSTNILIPGLLNTQATTPGTVCNFQVRVSAPASASATKSLQISGNYINTDASPGSVGAFEGAARNTSTAALTGLRVFASSGNIATGTFRLYGIKKT